MKESAHTIILPTEAEVASAWNINLGVRIATVVGVPSILLLIPALLGLELLTRDISIMLFVFLAVCVSPMVILVVLAAIVGLSASLKEFSLLVPDGGVFYQNLLRRRAQILGADGSLSPADGEWDVSALPFTPDEFRGWNGKVRYKGFSDKEYVTYFQ